MYVQYSTGPLSISTCTCLCVCVCIYILCLLTEIVIYIEEACYMSVSGIFAMLTAPFSYIRNVKSTIPLCVCVCVCLYSRTIFTLLADTHMYTHVCTVCASDFIISTPYSTLSSLHTSAIL